MAAALKLSARQGDTLDALLSREAARGPSALASVLEANPGLAGLGVILPAGTIVNVPATAPSAATLPLTNLWD
ncbi:MAG TPA: tail protein X [Sphingobium sp.]|uniref:tail protein X n=1 Tax=Sphingobium sp. TaxID=1912891 RepID=UPI002ED1B6DE